MAFALRRHRRVKISKGQLPLFVEKNFDGRALLVGVFDYTTCQRTDGSFYGTGGTCRKGTEVNSKDYEKIKEAQKAQDKVWRKMSGPDGAKLDAAARLEMAATVTDVSVSEKKYKEIEGEFERRKEEYTERFRKGEITGEEMDDMVNNFQFAGDASKAPMMIVGIEGTPPGNVKDPKVYDEHMGEQLARHSMKAPGSKYDSNEVDFVLSGKTVETVQPFTKSTADMMTKLSGDSISAGEALYGTRVAAAELRTLKASKEEKWHLGDRPGVKNNPELNERIGTRDGYEKRYGPAMAQNLKNRIQASVEGKGEHILLVTSKDDPNAAALRKEIGTFVKSQAGSRTTSFSYTTGQYTGSGKKGLEDVKKDRLARTGTIHEIPKPNGKKAYIYDLGVGVSSKWVNSPGPEGLASVLVRERQRMQSFDFKPRTKNQVEAANQNREFARQRRQGKKPTGLAGSSNIQNLTDANVKRAAQFGGTTGKRAQQELVRRGLAGPSTPAPTTTRKTTSRATSNNKTKATPISAKRPEPTMSQKEQRKAQLEGLLVKAKADRNSGFIAQLEGMIAAL